MPIFEIDFAGDATGDNIAAIERELTAIGPGPVQQGDDSFTATLNWGTTQKSLNNLRGRLNGVADNKVTAVRGVGTEVQAQDVAGGSSAHHRKSAAR